MTRRVLEPFQLGPLSLRNRIVLAPITTQYADTVGQVTEQLLGHYEARARGGTGLIIVEATYIEPVAQAFSNQLGIYEDTLLSGLSELAAVIKRHGAVAAIQLHHGGRMAKPALTGIQPVGPSAIAGAGGVLPAELSKEQIGQVVKSFARAAVRAKEAGFDAVELHGAHGYLIDQFISAAANKRGDEYGGGVSNRVRFLVQVLEAVRAATGSTYPVWVRTNAREYGVEGGTSLEEGLEVAKLAERAGSIAINVSSYGPSTPTNRTTAVFKPAVIQHLAAAVKQVVSVPVMVVGRITPESAERILGEGDADLIAIGKALLADPELPNKLAVGREEDIVPCIVCMHCRDTLQNPDIVGIRCQVNPKLARDHESLPPAPAVPKKVLIVGAGAAGMTSALVAARRGHDVTVWEKSSTPGGQLLQAAVPPHKDAIGFFTRYLESQLHRLGVTVHCREEATVESVQRFHPDAVVVATGPKNVIPAIPGLESTAAVSAGDALNGTVKVGKRVVVIGGELVGCETAEYLVEQGKTVTVVRRGQEMATSIGPSLRPFFLERLRKKGVVLLPGVRYQEMLPGGLVIETPDGATRILEADTFVLASGAVADMSLYEGLRGKVPELHSIGDCVAPQAIAEAVRDGYAVGEAL
ncbi:MAG: FAD-dependent oxidoreductase [Dehalococcoidia bacterium]|nr:FAD-dependent oxidoreductase [Dehalococcoidia bacterium]